MRFECDFPVTLYFQNKLKYIIECCFA